MQTIKNIYLQLKIVVSDHNEGTTAFDLGHVKTML